MRLDRPIEHVIREIGDLDRDACILRLRSFRQPRLDFSDDFLRDLTLERLRHILLAACLQARGRAGAD